MRIAIVNKDKCQPRQCSKECIKYCPRVRTGDETITFDDSGKIQISEELCVGCGICIKKCYFNAIMIVGLPESLNKSIHRYGNNGFMLFGLPIPQKGKITGILGPNGIGKSTALKILAGSIIPNFGEDNSSKKKVLDYFSGTLLHEHFKNLYDQKIKISIKPQYIDLIPKMFNGTVNELLNQNKLNKDKLCKLINNLDLSLLLERKISELSGGELQRVAITICISKDADLYFLDEISSYLDIYQRIQVSRVIKEFSEKKSIIVIEHDLALLDLLADTIHITYGEPSAYGVLTLPKSVRVGINQYIHGFLPEENIRIRNEEIKFNEHPPKSEKDIKTLISYNSFFKKLGSFELTASKGTIKEGEVIGIVGANGIGKSTFIKILSGVIKVENDDKFDINVKVSYKPQYIKSCEKIKVKDLFLRINPSIINSSYFSSEFEKPLCLNQLYDSFITDLSGGELQRVAIAVCLIQEADLYVLDEPSAHLDVEQRANVTKMINKFTENNKKTTMVVDHDIYMIDMISNRLIVFDGEPTQHGASSTPLTMNDGMNKFLSMLNITFRRDEETKRPRINNFLSRLDREQKEKGEYYYYNKK